MVFVETNREAHPGQRALMYEAGATVLAARVPSEPSAPGASGYLRLCPLGGVQRLRKAQCWGGRQPPYCVLHRGHRPRSALP
mmetsp:Transcript_47085/g.117882  ORF Transcript_47085/g.117882 Transcript_47085/m.117882 type:complete len:82 (+) Transcript_47085:65-310(+)